MRGEPVDYEEIKKYTSNFDKECLISEFQFGKIYRGRNGNQKLTVKLWDKDRGRGWCMLMEELHFFNNGKYKGYPNAIAFCEDEDNLFAVVYDFDPIYILHNLIHKDTFSWVNRIKVALGIATAVRSFLPYMIRNIQAAHILCDEDYTPKLYDFGMACAYTEKWMYDGETGGPGYTDPYLLDKGVISTKTDTFAIGLVLLGLITKRVVNTEVDTDLDFVEWAEMEYNLKKGPGVIPSLVHPSLSSLPYFYVRDGRSVTRLAMQCIRYEPDHRPNIDQILETLKSLKIVRENGKDIGVDKMLERL